jgi:hypothetical protein
MIIFFRFIILRFENIHITYRSHRDNAEKQGFFPKTHSRRFYGGLPPHWHFVHRSADRGSESLWRTLAGILVEDHPAACLKSDYCLGIILCWQINRTAVENIIVR